LSFIIHLVLFEVYISQAPSQLNFLLTPAALIGHPEHFTVYKVGVTNSKQSRDSCSNYNSTYVQGKDIDVHVPGCDSENRWFDTW